MQTGLWVSASGAAAIADQISTISNNLANLNTHGFKKDQPTFKEYAVQIEQPRELIDIPPGPTKDKDLYSIQDREQSFVKTDGIYTQFNNGKLERTNRSLDLAIEGKGFFEVLTPQGIRFTKAGNFKLNNDGSLVTAQGFFVLAKRDEVANNDNPVDRIINLSNEGHIQIDENGFILSQNQPINQISVLEFQKLLMLKKSGHQLFEDLGSNNKQEPIESRIMQGMLESSNVNPVEELSALIMAHRLFEQNLKAMKAADELMQKESNEIGRLS